VRVVLEVRRFRCGNPACPVATFAEQVPGLASCYQRRTAGLRDLLEKVALVLAGRAASRLAAAMDPPPGPDSPEDEQRPAAVVPGEAAGPHRSALHAAPRNRIPKESHPWRAGRYPC